MVKTFYNPATGVVVHTRQLMDGFAIACENARCPDIVPVGYFVNIRTYKDLIAELVSARGFYEMCKDVALPSVPTPTILVIPAVALQPNILEDMSMRARGLGVETDSGENVGFRFSTDESDGFADESETWTLPVDE